MFGSLCIAMYTRARCSGVSVTTTPASKTPPPPAPCADTAAPARDVSRCGLYTSIPPGATVPSTTYSSNDIDTVPAATLNAGADSSAGGSASGSACSAACWRPAKRWWCTSLNVVGGTWSVRYPPSLCAAAAPAFCASVSAIERLLGGVPARLAPAPSRGTGDVPLPPMEAPARVPGASTARLNPISRTPVPRSRRGPCTSSSGPVSPTATMSTLAMPANRFPDRSENAVFGTVRSSWPPVPYACLTVAARAGGRSSTAVRPVHAAAGTAPARDSDEPLAASARMPDALNADRSTCSSNWMRIVPLARSSRGTLAFDGAPVSGETATCDPGSGKYHPRLPTG